MKNNSLIAFSNWDSYEWDEFSLRKFAFCIPLIRHTLGFTLEELSKKSGVSYNTMNRIEHGEIRNKLVAFGFAYIFKMECCRLFEIEHNCSDTASQKERAEAGRKLNQIRTIVEKLEYDIKGE